jgi:acyl dehydratase
MPQPMTASMTGSRADAGIEVGQKASLKRSFSVHDLEAFSEVSGDMNPLHLDAHYAENTSFGRPIVHGALTSALFSALLGNHLPGPGTVLIGQMLKYLNPVYVGETVTATVEVRDIQPTKGIIRLSTRASTSRGLCIDGEVVVKSVRTLRA